jgi:plasmid stability protein
MEAEAREILRCALAKQKSRPLNLADALYARFAPLGGLNLPEIPREPGREPPDFSE